MDDFEVLSFLRDQAARAKWITSVCTGSLLLGAAGLLKGYQATCHWASRDQLALFGAEALAALFDEHVTEVETWVAQGFVIDGSTSVSDARGTNAGIGTPSSL